MSCSQLSNEAKRSCYVIEYAHITRITMKMEAMQYACQISLTLLYHNGTQEIWRISNVYRSPSWIAQHIIAAHLRFMTSSLKDNMEGK
ncbi:hypothetical protein KSF_025700 [Reticulibacter mediterranei]|uniref:Uncharacterized protein n=1 Tax=Reticulibacter mediterranei TaxID=2778369 RepID=A0A8J3N2V9_9CHLR|nr:hypothetical protein [Reticulibacter mediterranei]GHO92522.1 hypothetical protein KSF_025700 [Reticulibacter mediterranei]